jgi:hypothetical protein
LNKSRIEANRKLACIFAAVRIWFLFNKRRMLCEHVTWLDFSAERVLDSVCQYLLKLINLSFIRQTFYPDVELETGSCSEWVSPGV